MPRTGDYGLLADAFEDEKRDRDEVRDVEGPGGEGQNGVECRGRANVDQGEEDDNESDEPNSADRYTVMRIDLQ